MRTTILLIVLAMMAGCAAPGMQNSANRRQQSTVLQLWSDHKSLDVPVGLCGEMAAGALTALGFSNVARNGFYAYGNFEDSRAAVKCVEMPEGSFVYFAVASPRKGTAEELRNRIARQF
jgi:hypothetical protein